MYKLISNQTRTMYGTYLELMYLSRVYGLKGRQFRIVHVTEKGQIMTKFYIGDKVEVIDQCIRGVIVHADEWHIVIEDDDSETDDNRLEYRASDLKLIEGA